MSDERKTRTGSQSDTGGKEKNSHDKALQDNKQKPVQTTADPDSDIELDPQSRAILKRMAKHFDSKFEGLSRTQKEANVNISSIKDTTEISSTNITSLTTQLENIKVTNAEIVERQTEFETHFEDNDTRLNSLEAKIEELQATGAKNQQAISQLKKDHNSMQNHQRLNNLIFSKIVCAVNRDDDNIATVASLIEEVLQFRPRSIQRAHPLTYHEPGGCRYIVYFGDYLERQKVLNGAKYFETCKSKNGACKVKEDFGRDTVSHRTQLVKIALERGWSGFKLKKGFLLYDGRAYEMQEGKMVELARKRQEPPEHYRKMDQQKPGNQEGDDLSYGKGNTNYDRPLPHSQSNQHYNLDTRFSQDDPYQNWSDNRNIKFQKPAHPQRGRGRPRKY